MYVSGIASATRDGPMRTSVGAGALLALLQRGAVALAPGARRPRRRRCGGCARTRRRGCRARRRAGRRRVPRRSPQHRSLVAGVVRRRRRPTPRRHPRRLRPRRLRPLRPRRLRRRRRRAAPRPARRRSSGSTCGGDAGRAAGGRRRGSWSPMARRGDVDLDRRPGCCPACASTVSVEEQLLEQAAVLHAGGLAVEVERDLGAHRDVAADADEVDVHQLAPGGVALDLAGEGERALAVDVEGDQRVGARLAGEDVLQLAGGHGDGDGVGAEAVDDGRAPCPRGGGGRRGGSRARCAARLARVMSGMAREGLRENGGTYHCGRPGLARSERGAAPES